MTVLLINHSDMANIRKRPLSPRTGHSISFSRYQPHSPIHCSHISDERNHHSLARSDKARKRRRSLPVTFASFMSGFTVDSGFRDGSWRQASLGTKTINAIAPMTMGNTTNSPHGNVMARTSPAMSRKFAFDGLSALTNPAAQMGDPPIPPPLLSRESVSTVSESTDSSPTTTSSTFDSPIIVDTTPDSSPESPTALLPLPSIKTTHHHDGQFNQQSLFLRPIDPAANMDLPLDSPNRRAKNLKNLSLRLPTSGIRPSLSTAPLAEGGRHMSEPPSPVRPHSRGSRRRPPNLTIMTPGFQRPYTSNGTRVPATPSTRPSLRHIESSPSLNSILSPTHTNPTFPAPFASKPDSLGLWDDSDLITGILSGNQAKFNANSPLMEFGEEDDCPISRESRKGSERGYPDGPICIYDSGLYLYLEPNREEASQFDVVFNVAKEVNNPFKNDRPKPDTVMSVWKATLAQSNAALREEDPATATSVASFKSAFESLPNSALPPQNAESVEPEYIHVPWDHNSEILDDLLPLCEIIDDRISKGKKVLIHCQLGVSRSASLVIAYGLFKNPHLDFNAVYGKVKERSCWVGPNMSLIYQLTDFRTKIRGGTIAKSPIVETTRQQTGDRSVPTLANPASGTRGKSPVDASKLFSQINPFNSNNRVRRNVAPRPLPLREKFHTVHALRTSPRQEGFPSSISTYQRPALRPAFQMDLVMQDVPPSPSFFSPKVAEFTATPSLSLARTAVAVKPSETLFENPLPLPHPAPSLPAAAAAAAAVVELPSPVHVRRPSLNDPRSPQRRLEPIIMRSIDEFL